MKKLYYINIFYVLYAIKQGLQKNLFHNIKRYISLLYVVFLLLTILSCQNSSPKQEKDKATIQKWKPQYAQNFEVEQYADYKILTVRQEGLGEFRYVLYDRQKSKPEGIKDAIFVPIPIQKLISLSTNYLAFIENLGETDKIVGISGTKYVSSPTILKRIAQNQIAEVGTGGGTEANIEKVVELSPDIVLTYNMQGYNTTNKLQEAGQKVIINAEFAEKTPLGQAEWIKFFALFVGKEKQADSIFASIATNYQALAQKNKTITPKPSVFCNIPYKDVWYMPAGENFSAQFIADAGGNYLWASEKGNINLPLSFEAVFAKASDADIWINASDVGDLNQLQNIDNRFKKFAAFQQGKVYNYGFKKNSAGANDYFESGILRVDLILRDLVMIFHPNSLPNQKMTYYKKL